MSGHLTTHESLEDAFVPFDFAAYNCFRVCRCAQPPAEWMIQREHDRRYLTPDARWATWKQGARFSSASEADAFATCIVSGKSP